MELFFFQSWETKILEALVNMIIVMNHLAEITSFQISRMNVI